MATDAAGQRVYAFEDSEIQAFTVIEMSVWQSAQFFSAATSAAGQATLPNPPYPWRRIAANMLDSLAANQARLSIIAKLLDVTINPGAVKAMRDQAAYLREVEDNAMSFVIVEQVNDVFSFRDRYWKQVQRQQGGGF